MSSSPGRPGHSGHVSSAVVIAPSLPPVPCVDAGLSLGGGVVDLATRVLVAGVVPAPRFGREGEVVATAAALVASGADLVDVSLPPRMIGPAARAGEVPVVVRVASVEQAAAAGRAGAAAVLVPAGVLARRGRESEPPALGPSRVVVVDDLADLTAARAVAERLRLPLAFDSTGWSSAAAIAREAAAVAEGCRLIRTTDVRRSRRVAEVMAAILGARRAADDIPPADDSEAQP